MAGRVHPRRNVHRRVDRGHLPRPGPDVPAGQLRAGVSDMHRELHQVYVNGDMVIVQLALQGTHDGPLQAGDGIIAPTGNRMDAPCCDVFQLRDGRIERFDCYPSGTVILAQLGVLGALDAAITRS
ncbi:ester cyclase [Pseudofrankia sp. BMG5.37]|nr:ester cyclase [Pseudofrankia sp. BMG5.37]